MDADTRYSTLTIHSLLLGDSGTYTCVSVNPRGSSTDSVIIEVLRKYHITRKMIFVMQGEPSFARGISIMHPLHTSL